jgi:hypothetical protein
MANLGSFLNQSYLSADNPNEVTAADAGIAPVAAPAVTQAEAVKAAATTEAAKAGWLDQELIKGIQNKYLAIGAGLVAAILLLKRKKG